MFALLSNDNKFHLRNFKLYCNFYLLTTFFTPVELSTKNLLTYDIHHFFTLTACVTIQRLNKVFLFFLSSLKVSTCLYRFYTFANSFYIAMAKTIFCDHILCLCCHWQFLTNGVFTFVERCRERIGYACIFITLKYGLHYLSPENHVVNLKVFGKPGKSCR